jgi:mRNA-degrading endonuclease RelE of RelBE toxin-antitoxin system
MGRHRAMSLTIVNYTAYFKRDIHHLIKKYPRLKQDIKPVITQLEEGELLGDVIQHIGYSVYKVRIKNSDNNKGKSAGYRMIYYVKKEDSIILLRLYSKSEQSDISAKEICSIIEKWHEGE